MYVFVCVCIVLERVGHSGWNVLLIWRASNSLEQRQRTPINLDIEKALHLIISLTGSFLFYLDSVQQSHWAIKRTSTLQYFPFSGAVRRLYYEIGEKWFEISVHIRSLWFNQDHHSTFLTQGFNGSAPEASPWLFQKEEKCMCLA